MLSVQVFEILISNLHNIIFLKAYFFNLFVKVVDAIGCFELIKADKSL